MTKCISSDVIPAFVGRRGEAGGQNISRSGGVSALSSYKSERVTTKVWLIKIQILKTKTNDQNNIE